MGCVFGVGQGGLDEDGGLSKCHKMKRQYCLRYGGTFRPGWKNTDVILIINSLDRMMDDLWCKCFGNFMSEKFSGPPVGVLYFLQKY